MKSIRLFPLASLAVLLSIGCDKPAPSAASETAKQLAEMERKADEAIARQQELEQQLEDQKLAAERDAIERERMELDEARAASELQQSQTAEADAEKIRLREEALASREATLEAQRTASEDKEIQLRERDIQLSASERERAGSQALNRDETAVDQTPVGDYGTFYDSLSSYGSWFETPNYGYVWQPGVVRDSAWRPYTRGRWVCSDYGWTWVSEEPFGWATYHYGRWALVSDIGWVWVPGSEWAPSWVSWRTSGSHIGWAPLPPETLAYRQHHWDSSVDVTFSIGALWFNFVETRYFDRPIHRHCLPYRANHTFFHQTNNITNIHVQNNCIISGGPRYADLSRSIGRTLPFCRLDMDRRSRPSRDSLTMQPRIDGSRLRIAAPSIDAPWNDNLKPKHVKKRLDSISVERTKILRPEITEQFRRSREENQRKAEQSVETLGGRETFERRRIEQLEANRLKLDQQKRKTQEVKESRDTRDTRDTRETRPQDPPKDRVDHGRQADDLATRPTRDEQNRKRPDSTPNPADTPSVPPLPREQPESVKLGQPSSPTETPRQANQPDLQPKTGEVKNPREQSRQKPLDEARQKQPQPDKEIPPQPSRRQPSESPRSNDPIDPQPRVENTQRQREQATRETQQREAQREQARKTQINNARREQAEQLQQNTQRQREQATRETQQQEAQREQARQTQMDNARREQAEQLQQNTQRQREQATREAQQQQAQREQARQTQMDNARREQAREAQQEAEREQSRQKQRTELQRESTRKPSTSSRQEDENTDPSRFRRR